MKTLRAFLWGSALGALVGLILAPQRDAIVQAQLDAERDQGARASSAASGAQTTQTAQPVQATNSAQAASEAPVRPSTAATSPSAPSASSASSTERGSDGRRYVGNLNTKIYHEATDANLPNEENRAYFGSPDEAESAGYRQAQ